MVAVQRNRVRSVWRMLLVIAVCTLTVVILCRLSNTDEEASRPSARPGASPATTQTTSQPSTTQAATGPATSRPTLAWNPPRFTERLDDRRRMLRVLRGYGLRDQDVLDAMLAVPRHEFVPDRYTNRAYDDTPLPIGFGQTISQPYIVAEMTRVLGLSETSRVLEVGTGSGYQAAVLSELTPHVCTIEIIPDLAEAARRRLERLGYGLIRIRQGDGYYGWAEQAPFDAIIVTAAAQQIPPPLVRQLGPGGRMVIPVGPPLARQSLMLVEKDPSGQIRTRSLMAVRFVPLVHREQ